MELVVLAGLLGADIDLRVLAMASGRDLDTCLDDLDPAVVSHVLVPATPGRFSFAHALVRDALTADVSPLRRARLHLKAADALESLYGVDRDHAEPIAMHRWAALSVGDPLDAAKALVTAAGIAAGRGALARADDLIELALSAAGVAPTGPRRLDLEIDALETLLRIETLRSFMGERLDEIADRIDGVAERHDSDAARVLAHFTRWSNINRGDYRAMDQWALAARDLAERSTVPYVRLLGRHTWGSHCWLRGWITESVATFRMLLDEDEELRAASPEVRLAPVNHGMNACAPFALAGDEENTARALAAADVKVQARIPTNPASRVDAVFTPALVTAIRGEAARTRDITAGLVRGDLEAEQPHFSPASRIMHGWGEVLTSGSSEPLDLIVRAVAEIDATPVKVGMPMFRSLYAEALLHLGRSADAAAILRDIAAVSEADGDGWWLPETLRLLALAEAANGADPAATAALLARARALADEQGEQLLVMRIDVTIAAQ